MLRRLPALATLLALAACADVSSPISPESPAPDTREVLASISRTASTQTHSVQCGAPSTRGARAVLIGGQNQYVTLTSSNIVVAADTFSFDVTVRNLIPQPLGTTDGQTVDPAGVRVFFQSGPVATSGSGTVTVANADGTATFTSASQPYFQYNTRLPQDSTSGVKRWKLQFTPGVQTFAFTVYVSAAV